MAHFYTNVAVSRNKVLVRSIKDGRRLTHEVAYRPYLFVPTDKASSYRTIHGQKVAKLDFESVYAMNEYIKQYKDVENFEYYGMTSPVYTFISDNSKGEIAYDASQIRLVFMDIEVDSANGFPVVETAAKQVLSITLRMDGKNYVFGLKPYTPEDANTEYVQCKDETELLKVFIQAWTELDADVVTGWNTSLFDIPYLVNRITNVLSQRQANRLSPWGLINAKTFNVGFGKEQTEYELVGIASLDYLFLYRKFAYTPQETFRLDHIAQTELGKKKTDYSEFKSMSDFYHQDHQKFINYNINDCVLVEELEKKKGIIAMVYAMTYDSKTNFRDCFTPTRTWDVIIYNHLFEQGIVVPAIKHSEGRTIEGAYVKEPIIGQHKWVVSLDLDSLYPHLIMQYNISPETLREHIADITVDEILDGQLNMLNSFCEDRNVTIAATGDVFDKSMQGFLPLLMKRIYDGRVVWKRKMLDAKQLYEDTKDPALVSEIDRCKNMQHQLKITLNSGYGAVTNQYFRWYDPRLGESVTKSGQVAIRWIEKKVNNFLNTYLGTENYDYVVASDTDSLYLRLESLVASSRALSGADTNRIVDFLDDFVAKQLAPIIEHGYDELFKYTHAYTNAMRMKRETIASKGIWTGKKHYILNAWDIEGVRYHQPELKVTGIESVRSSTPTAFRQSIKDALKVIMNGTQADLIQFVESLRQRLRDIPLDEIAFPRSVNDLTKYSSAATIYGKKCPVAVKGALIFNYLLKQKALTEQYELIVDSEKIKFLYLLVPNPIKEKVVSFTRVLPPEFGLEAYVDYKTQFDKGFVVPVSNILSVIGWSIEERGSLEEFFE